MDGLVKWLKARAQTRGSMPKRIDECIYSPFSYHHQDTGLNERTPDGLEQIIEEENENGSDTESVLSIVKKQPRFLSEVFLFNYGVVVIWGMTEQEEERFLKDIEKFEKDKLSEDAVQVENFNYYITSSYQPRIYNDFITLKDGHNYMYKLSISHAIAQSAKVCILSPTIKPS